MATPIERLTQIYPDWKRSHQKLADLFEKSRMCNDMLQIMHSNEADNWGTFDTTQVIIPVISRMWAQEDIMPDAKKSYIIANLRQSCPNLPEIFVNSFFTGEFGAQPHYAVLEMFARRQNISTNEVELRLFEEMALQTALDEVRSFLGFE